MYWKNAPAGKSKYFKMFLEQLKSNNPGKTPVLILDNVRIHIAKYIQQYLRGNEKIHLFFLPTYSLEYNPIVATILRKRFWLWLKRNVYGFKSFGMMESLLRMVRKIIWNYIEGRIEHCINFKMNIYSVLL